MSSRTGENIAKITGVVSADSEERALEKAWELAGSDTAFGFIVEEIDLEKGYKHTVYKASI